MKASRAVVHVIHGTTRGYDEGTHWEVEAWLDRGAAEARCAALNDVAKRYREKYQEHSWVIPRDEDDPDGELYARWSRKSERMLKTARREADDPQFEDYASYSIGTLALK